MNRAVDFTAPKSGIYRPEAMPPRRDKKWTKVYLKLCQPYIEEKLRVVLKEKKLAPADLVGMSVDGLRDLWRVAFRRWHSTTRNNLVKASK